LGFLNATTSKLTTTPATAGGVIEVFFWALTNNILYDVQVDNTPLRPYQLRLFYMGTTAITLGGTAAPLRAFVVAPFAQVTVAADTIIYGGVLADTLIVNSGAAIHYDSSMAGEGIVEDMQYRIRQLTQVYR